MPMFDLYMSGDAHLWNVFPGLDRGRIFIYGSTKDRRLMRLFSRGRQLSSPCRSTAHAGNAPCVRDPPRQPRPLVNP
jgi:hypothetical protein